MGNDLKIKIEPKKREMITYNPHPELKITKEYITKEKLKDVQKSVLPKIFAVCRHENYGNEHNELSEQDKYKLKESLEKYRGDE